MQLLILCEPVWFSSFALEIDLRAAEMLRQALGKIERARTTDIVGT